MRGLLIAGVVCLAVTPLAAESAVAAGAPARFCPNISYYGKHYPVRVNKGKVSCVRARKVLRHFFRAVDRQFSGWRCFYGHGSDTYAGVCIRGSERRPKVIIRAYNPVD